jgi:hypothetical protein
MQTTPSDSETSPITVPLDGYVMRLRPSELKSVASGLAAGGSLAPAAIDSLAPAAVETIAPAALAEALKQLPTIDRPPTWELSVRHFGRRKPLPQAAGEIGMDLLHAQDLVKNLGQALSASPA